MPQEAPPAEGGSGQAGQPDTAAADDAAHDRRRALTIALFIILSLVAAFVLAFWYAMPSAN